MGEFLTPQEKEQLTAHIKQLIVAKREELKRDFQKALLTPPKVFQPQLSPKQQLHYLKKQRFVLEQRAIALQQALEKGDVMTAEKAWKALQKTYHSLEKIDAQMNALQRGHALTR